MNVKPEEVHSWTCGKPACSGLRELKSCQRS